MSTPQLFVRMTFNDCIGALRRRGVQVMRRYPEYKESGVEWIGEILVHFDPQRWSLMRVLLDENLLHETTMTFPPYTLRSAPIHWDSKLERG